MSTKQKMVQYRHKLYTRHPYCWYCGHRFGTSRHATLDHLIPLSMEGPNNTSNVVLSCASCNQKRGNGIKPIGSRNSPFAFSWLVEIYKGILQPQLHAVTQESQLQDAVEIARYHRYLGLVLGHGGARLSHGTGAPREPLTQYRLDLLAAKQEWWEMQVRNGLPQHIPPTPVHPKRKACWPHGDRITDQREEVQRVAAALRRGRPAPGAGR